MPIIVWNRLRSLMLDHQMLCGSGGVVDMAFVDKYHTGGRRLIEMTKVIRKGVLPVWRSRELRLHMALLCGTRVDVDVRSRFGVRVYRCLYELPRW